MDAERVRRILRPSMALVALALGMVVLGGLIAAPVRAASATSLPAASVAVTGASKPGEPVVRAGEDVVVPAGTSTQTVVAAGGDVTVDGSVTDAVVAFGGNVVVNGSVGSSVVAFGGDITVKGTVGASVVAFGGDVTLLPGSVVGTSMKASDKAVVLFGGQLTRDPGAQVTGSTAVYDNANWTGAASWFGNGIGQGITRPWWGFGLLGWVIQAAIFLVLGLVAAALLPKQMRAVQRKLREKTAASLGWGALAFFVIAPAVLVVLVISVVGLLLVVPYAVFLALFYFFAITSVGALVAGFVLSGTKSRDSLMLAVVIGVLATTVISKVPVAGFLAILVMAVFGTGAAILAYGEHRRLRRAAMTPAPAPAGGPGGTAVWQGAGAPAGVDVTTGTAADTATAGAMLSGDATGAAPAPLGDAYLPATPPLPPEPAAAPEPPVPPAVPEAPVVPEAQAGTADAASTQAAPPVSHDEEVRTAAQGADTASTAADVPAADAAADEATAATSADAGAHIVPASTGDEPVPAAPEAGTMNEATPDAPKESAAPEGPTDEGGRSDA